MVLGDEWEKVTAEGQIWLPAKEGEILTGEIVEIVSGAYGKQLLIKDARGTLWLSPSHKALQARLNKLEVGEFVSLEFKRVELPKVKGQQGTRIYEVYHKRRGN